MTPYRKNWKGQVAWLKRTSTLLEKEILDLADTLPPERLARLIKIQMRLLERAKKIEGATTPND